MVISKRFMKMQINVYNDGTLVLNGKVEEFLVDNEWDEEIVARMELFQLDEKLELIEWDNPHSGNWKVCKYLELTNDHDEQMWKQGYEIGKAEREKTLLDFIHVEVKSMETVDEIKEFIRTKRAEYCVSIPIVPERKYSARNKNNHTNDNKKNTKAS